MAPVAEHIVTCPQCSSETIHEATGGRHHCFRCGCIFTIQTQHLPRALG